MKRWCNQCKKIRTLEVCSCGCRTTTEIPIQRKPSDESDTFRKVGDFRYHGMRERISYNDVLYEVIPHDGGPQRNNSKR